MTADEMADAVRNPPLRELEESGEEPAGEDDFSDDDEDQNCPDSALPFVVVFSGRRQDEPAAAANTRTQVLAAYVVAACSGTGPGPYGWGSHRLEQE